MYLRNYASNKGLKQGSLQNLDAYVTKTAILKKGKEHNYFKVDEDPATGIEYLDNARFKGNFQKKLAYLKHLEK